MNLCLRCFATLLVTFATFTACGAAAEDSMVVLEQLSLDELQTRMAQAPAEEQGRLNLHIGFRKIDSDLNAAAAHFELAEEQLLTDDTTGRAMLAAMRCIKWMLNGDLDKAEGFCHAAREMAGDDPYARVKAYSCSAQLLFQTGQVRQSVAAQRQAVAAAAQLGDRKIRAAQHNNLGIIVRAQGQYEHAIAHFRDALELMDNLSDPLYFLLSFNIGLAYADMGEHALAKDFYTPTLKWAQDTEAYRREMTAIVYIAQADIALGQAAQAEQALLIALARPELKVNQGYLAFAYATLAEAQLAQNKLVAAAASYEQGIAIAEQQPNTYEQRRLYVGYPRVLARQGRVEEAVASLETTLARFRAEGATRDLMDGLEVMSQIRRDAGDVTGSFAAYDELAKLTRQAHGLELAQQLAELRAVYEVDRKERALVAADRDLILRNGAVMLLVAFVLIGYLFISRRNEMQRRQLQAQVAEKLEQEVMLRTREIQQRMQETEAAIEAKREMEGQLAEAEKLRVLGQLTGGVAHDFNNLLTVVSGAAELLKMGVDEDKKDELVDHIITAAHSGADITRALMAYARKQPMQVETIELLAFLKERVPIINRAMGGIVLVRFDPGQIEPVELSLDPAQLTTALLNLCLNARDAQRGGEIELSLEHRGDTIAICVEDQGVGMDQTQLNYAVEPFYTTKTDNQGNGLGLSMVYGFAKQIGGDLEIESQPDKGTTVRIVLPLNPVLPPDNVLTPEQGTKVGFSPATSALESNGDNKDQ